MDTDYTIHAYHLHVIIYFLEKSELYFTFPFLEKVNLPKSTLTKHKVDLSEEAWKAIRAILGFLGVIYLE